jgi:hypothetical protein
MTGLIINCMFLYREAIALVVEHSVSFSNNLTVLCFPSILLNVLSYSFAVILTVY